MQDYSTQQSRNPSRAANANLKNGAAIGGGGNQTQGAGMIPGKVSVPMPGTDTTQPRQGGGMKKAPAGFNNGLIAGKI
jgi:hypothetical protein